MTITLSNNDTFDVSFFSYGKSRDEIASMSNESDPPIASFNIETNDDDMDIQRTVLRYINALTSENIRNITIDNDGKTRKYSFTECVSCQAIITDSREYINVILR